MDRCTSCYGSKTILGLGQIEGKCYVCKGTGERQYIADISENEYLGIKDGITPPLKPAAKTTKGMKRG